MKRTIVSVLFLVLVAIPVLAAPVTCPFDIPVVTIAPHTVNGFSWGSVIRPMDDPCVSDIEVEPTNMSAWYVGGFNGLYMTKTFGTTWTKPLNGNVSALLLVPGNPQLVYVGIGNQLWLSRDHGANWNVIRTFSTTVTSILVANSTLYVGLGWNTHAVPSGIWIGNLGAGLMTFHAFGPGHTGLIVWTLARDPVSGVLYAGTEIFDHPQPYDPPFFRSGNNGSTWTNVGAGSGLPWHVVATAVRPSDGYLYALTEGAGLYGSSNNGSTWQPPLNSTGPSVSLLMYPFTTTRLFGGRQKAGLVNGGAFQSLNSGLTFQPIGLSGVTVGGLALNNTGSRLFAATYGSGVYVATVP